MSIVSYSGKGTVRKKMILAIDDMPEVLQTTKALLQDEFTVYCMTNHSDALRFLASTVPDAILLDIEMPGMNGFDVVRTIRRLPQCRTVPIIFLTSNASIDNVINSVASGANDFIAKPVDHEILMSKIEKYI